MKLTELKTPTFCLVGVSTHIPDKLLILRRVNFITFRILGVGIHLHLSRYNAPSLIIYYSQLIQPIISIKFYPPVRN